MDDFGGHFLAAFEGVNADSDDDNASWCSGLTTEPGEDPFKTSIITSPVEWVPEEISTLNPFPFTGETGMKFNIENLEPIDIFNSICKPELIAKIILGTNAYARKQQKMDEEHYGHWKTLTTNEMRQFIGLVFHTGTIRMNNLSDYWSNDKLFDLKIFRTTMTLNRFLRILTALRFGNERIHQEEGEKSSMAFNLMLGDFMWAMQSVCYPGRELVIDDCQVVTKQGICSVESVDMTFTKSLMLVHSLSEPNGLVHNVLITETSNLNYGEIVSSLTFDKRRRGHSVFLGKPYCDVEIVRSLTFDQTYSTGILDKEADLVPTEMRCVELEKGGQPAMLFTEPGICLLKWRCHEDIYAISSEFRKYEENLTTTWAGSNRIKAPLMIRKARKIKTKADRKELLSSYKPLEGINLGSYRAIGLYFLQLMLTNSYILYCDNFKKIPLHEFRLSVIESLLVKEPNVELYPLPSVEEAGTETASSDLHIPKKFPKRTNQRPLRKRCRVCLHLGKRTDTYFHCAGCAKLPALCLDKCFAEYHQNILKNGPDSMGKSTKSDGDESVSQDDGSADESERDENDSQSSGGKKSMKRKTEEKSKVKSKKSKNGNKDNMD